MFNTLLEVLQKLELQKNKDKIIPKFEFFDVKRKYKLKKITKKYTIILPNNNKLCIYSWKNTKFLVWLSKDNNIQFINIDKKSICLGQENEYGIVEPTQYYIKSFYPCKIDDPIGFSSLNEEGKIPYYFSNSYIEFLGICIGKTRFIWRCSSDVKKDQIFCIECIKKIKFENERLMFLGILLQLSNLNKK